LKHFFEDIAGKIRSADQILIIGPGEVKIEFKTFLERSKSNASKLIGLETCDKMFDEDLVKWVVPVIKTHQPLK
jgi:stalled ribosome rescue protein Dom34